MFCKKCGAKIKDTEKFCPKCGTLAKEAKEGGSSGKNQQSIPSMASIYSLNEERSANDIGNTAEKMEKTVSIAVGSVSDGARKAFGKGRRTLEKLSESVQAESKGDKKKLVLVGAAVALVLVLAVINGARINNFLHKTFSSPEKYYQFVEKRNVAEIASNAGEWYGSYVLDMLNFYDKSIDGEVEIELGKDGQEFLALMGIAGADVSWLKSASVRADAAVKDDVFSFGAALRLNKSDILSGNLVMDMDDGNIYLQVPELNKTYLGLEPDLGYEFQEFQEFQAGSKALREAFPSQGQVEKLINRYMGTALDYVDDVERSKEVLEVEGVSQKCTVLKVAIDMGCFCDMMEAILKEMKTDKDIKAIMTNLAGISAMEISKDAYEEFQQEIEYTLEMLNDGRKYADSDEKIEMTVYVDGKGDITGRSIDWGTGKLSSLMAVNGKRLGYELSYRNGGMSIQLSGDGKKSGNALSGVFKLKYNGASLVDITAREINEKDLKKGRLNGGFDLEVSSQIASLIGYVPGLSVIEDIKLTVDSDSSGKSHKYEVGLLYDEQDIGSFVLTAKTGNGSKASIPAAKNTVVVNSGNDLMEWIDGIDLQNLISALNKAEVPSYYTDGLEDMIDTLEWYASYLF